MSDEPVLTAVCDEPEGQIERSVRPMILTVENLQRFWEESRHFKTLFSAQVNGDFKKFCELFLYSGPDGELRTNGLFWLVDDFVGVFYMTSIKPCEDAQVHYAFFDRRHFGRETLTREMIKYVFRKYNFRRLTVEIPYYASRLAFQFTESVGFKKEGRKRKAVYYNDDWFDVAQFGILKEEALNGS